jgi:hypothetical protein
MTMTSASLVLSMPSAGSCSSFPVAVHEELGAGPQVVRPRSAYDRPRMPVPAPDTPGVRVASCTVAPVERQILHLSRLDHGPQDRRLRFEQRGGAFDLDGFADEAISARGDLRALVHLQLNARALDLSKAGNFGGQPVSAGLQRRET